MQKLTSSLKIEQVILPHRVLLAPMSGITDLPFRELAFEAGAALVTSEMIASKEFCSTNSESELRANCKNLLYSSIQLLGREASYMAQAAIKLEEQGASIIDINMGCPAKKIISGMCGSALMRDLPLAFDIIEKVKTAVNIPVTLKMRLGWEGENNENAIELAKFAQELNLAMITIHARTRQQFYNGIANWKRIKEIKEAVNIPIIVNGDIICVKTAIQAMQESGADGVMIGRAAYGAPWKIGEIIAELQGKNYKKPNIVEYILKHYEKILSYYGKELGVRTARKHLVAYLKQHKTTYSQTKKNKLLKENCPKQVKKIIKDIFS